MGPDVSIVTLVAAFFALALLVVLLRSLRMPDEHVRKQERRNELRRILLKKKLRSSPDDRHDADDGTPAGGPSDQVH